MIVKLELLAVISRQEQASAKCWTEGPAKTFDVQIGDDPEMEIKERSEAERAHLRKIACLAALFLYSHHNLAYRNKDARVIKFVWANLVKNRMQGGARSFED